VQTRLVLSLTMLVAVPLAVMAWLGVRMVREDESAVGHRVGQLLAVTDRAAEALERWRGDGAGPVETVEALQELCRRTAAARQIFVVGSDGTLRLPDREAPASDRERAFLARSAQLWDEGQRFFRPEDRRGAAGSSSSSSSSSPSHGFHTWFHGGGLNLAFWRRLPSGAVVGVELDRMRLFADVIARMPDTKPDSMHDGLVVLCDGRGNVLYQWGTYVPAEDEQPRVELHASPPFGAWKFGSYGPGVGALVGSGLRRSLAVGLGALGLALEWLAVALYREATRGLREAEQRVTFVNQVSHELKTPLTNVRMYAELLADELDEDDEKAARYLGVIVGESQRLSRLIGNVLTFARSRRQGLSLRLGAGRVDEVVRATVERFRPALVERGLEVSVTGTAGALVLVDGDAVEQIVGNLLSNAEKYGAAGGVVEVAVAQDEGAGTTTVTVADRGPGIPAELRERVFEPFFRASDELTEGAAGTGIGLAIARELARLHGGDLRVLPGEGGARFELTVATRAAGTDERKDGP